MLVVLGVVLGTGHAAACPVVIAGDGEAADALRAALAPFGDDGAPCLALQVSVSLDADGLTVIELRDELGRVARRSFASADGAAAFLASWSRRPLPLHEAPPPRVSAAPVAPKRPVAPTRPVPPAVDDNDPTLVRVPSVELHGNYVFAPDSNPLVSVSGAVVGYHRNLRYGGELRVIGASVDAATPPSRYDVISTWIDSEALGTVGLEGRSPWLRARGEALLGAAVIIGVLQPSGNLQFETAGVRGAVRAAAELHVAGRLWFEASAGWELLVHPKAHDAPFANNIASNALHAEIGFMWEP